MSQFEQNLHRKQELQKETTSEGKRLAKYITGLSPDDPEMPERLINDHQIIRQKYKLPSRDAKFTNPSEYEHELRRIAKENDIDLRSKVEYSRFFEEYSAGAFHDTNIGRGNTVVADINRNEELSKYFGSLPDLEHELIHGLQEEYSPGMPIELREYEAYVGTISIKRLVQNKDDIEKILFGYFIKNSVDINEQTSNH